MITATTNSSKALLLRIRRKVCCSFRLNLQRINLTCPLVMLVDMQDVGIPHLKSICGHQALKSSIQQVFLSDRAAGFDLENVPDTLFRVVHRGIQPSGLSSA